MTDVRRRLKETRFLRRGAAFGIDLLAVALLSLPADSAGTGSPG